MAAVVGSSRGVFSPPTSPLDSPLSTLVRTRVGGSVTYQSHRLRHERGISGVFSDRGREQSA